MDDVAQFQAEMWSLYTVAVLFITLRLAARWRTVGFIGLQGDDYVIAITLVRWSFLQLSFRDEHQTFRVEHVLLGESTGYAASGIMNASGICH